MANFILAIKSIWRREIIRYWRDKTRLVSTFFQPLMFLVIFGAGLRQSLAGGNLEIDFLQFMYPGIIAMNVMGIAFFSTVSTVWDREFGFLREILVAPVPRLSIVFGKILGAVTIASVQALILLILAPFIGVKLEVLVVLQLFLLMLLLSFAISGIGLFIASLMKTTESFGIIMQVLIFPMFFLSGAFFPLTTAPDWMRLLSEANPLTYGVDAMRQVLLDPQLGQAVVSKIALHSVFFDVLALIFFAIITVSAAVLTFNRRD
ncbi:MAG: ABC-2 type transporter [Parcubacteria group bacterium GW2011_GWC2_42_6]|nr:MAG: ABC-2 type transporter [Parcubacteria group bacterium GW2011_GWA2_42_11]KKS66990.1 MAG: ABC-2 type transporter [Parcubacteria group bacterium GW2011_GWC2_42_6]